MRNQSPVKTSVRSVEIPTMGLTIDLAQSLSRRVVRECKRLQFDYYCAQEGHGDVDIYGIVFIDVVTLEPVVVKSVGDAEEVLANYRAQLKHPRRARALT